MRVVFEAVELFAEMHKVDIVVDRKESAALERRKIAEQQRRSRIFNARERIIGVWANF